MPFDGLVLRDRVVRRNELAETLTSLGIVPVSDAILQAHKRIEVAKHPGSVFYRRPDLHRMLVLGSFISTVLSIQMFMFCTPSDSWAVLMLLCPMICMIMMMRLTLFLPTVKGPARWVEKTRIYRREHLQSDFAKMPTPLLRLVDQVHSAAPALEFTIGTLFQEEKVLDPYVLVRCYDPITGMISQACLGIWDGKKIIHMAQTPKYAKTSI